MCMTLSVRHPRHGVVLATDQRATRKLRDGAFEYIDCGGKMVRVGGAWLAFTGPAVNIGPALEQVATFGCSDVATTVAVLERASDTAPSREHFTSFLVCDADTVVCVDYQRGTGTPTAFISLPHGNADGLSALASDFHAVLGAVRSVLDLVRVVAATIADGAELSPAVSPTAEIAVGDLYIVGRARDIGNATDAALLAALVEPPASLGISQALATFCDVNSTESAQCR